MGVKNVSSIKKGIYFLMILFISKSSYGQFYQGLEAGVYLTNAEFMSGESSEPTSTVGFSIGYVAERDLSENLYFRVAILANKRGVKAVNRRGINTTDETWRLNVIEIPINLGYYLNWNNRNRQFFIDGGLTFDYIGRGYVKNDNETITLDIGSEASIKRISTGVNIGAGLLFSKQIKVRLNYYYGLTNILNNEGDEWKNRGFGISFNYFLKKRELH